MGEIDHLELLQEVTPIGLEAGAVAAQEVVELVVPVSSLLAIGKKLGDGHDERGVADDPAPPVHHGRELCEGLVAVSGPGLGGGRGRS